MHAETPAEETSRSAKGRRDYLREEAHLGFKASGLGFREVLGTAFRVQGKEEDSLQGIEWGCTD